MLRQFFQLQLTPNIETPSYSVLQKFKVQNRHCLHCLRHDFVFVTLLRHVGLKKKINTALPAHGMFMTRTHSAILAVML